MKHWWAALLLVMAAPAAAQTAGVRPVEVMVLGTYHMGNTGRDIGNVRADDVTAPRRQRELQAVTDAIARWRPDRIVVESERPAPFTVPDYRSYTPADLATQRNEIVQIGYRLARQLGHREVYGFDEQPRPGEPDYFQFDRVAAFAAAHGMGARVTELQNYFQGLAAQATANQQRLSVAAILLMNNDPARDRELHARGYYGVLGVGDADAQVGAEFNAFWYLRNAKMFAKLGLIARPGERVLVLVGSGHRYWLTHFAGTVPGYRNVEPAPYLRSAAGR